MAVDKDILSIDSDDETIDYLSLERYLKDHTEREKIKLADNITSIGDELISEIDEKQKKQDVIKDKYIKYILKHNKKYSSRQLNSFLLSDVRDIYDDIKNNRNKLLKLFRFIFNL